MSVLTVFEGRARLVVRACRGCCFTAAFLKHGARTAAINGKWSCFSKALLVRSTF